MTGFDKVRDEIGEKNVLCARTLSDAQRAYHPEGTLFQTVEERLAASQIAEEVGAVLEKRHPLGWENSQALVVLLDWVPNNTLPILWKDGPDYRGKPWRGLFPRG